MEKQSLDMGDFFSEDKAVTVPICIKTLLESHGKPNVCGCPRCREDREREAAIEYYRGDYGREAIRNDPFVERGC